MANGVLNNGILDPLQGYDANVWTQDACVGSTPRLVGRYTSAVLTVRNATEAYLELDQRVPRYLDGEIQIAFVLERGILDTASLAEAMGYNRITRANRINRSPRISVTFSLDGSGQTYSTDDADPFRRADAPFAFNDDCNYQLEDDLDNVRSTVGRIKLLNCKIDSYNLAMTGGRGVIPMQLQGVAEGYEYIEGGSKKENLERFFGGAGF